MDWAAASTAARAPARALGQELSLALGLCPAAAAAAPRERESVAERDARQRDFGPLALCAPIRPVCARLLPVRVAGYRPLSPPTPRRCYHRLKMTEKDGELTP